MSGHLKENWNKKIKHIKRRYLILKVKWIAFFVLPILIIIAAYQAAKQYLKLRISELCKENA